MLRHDDDLAALAADEMTIAIGPHRFVPLGLATDQAIGAMPDGLRDSAHETWTAGIALSRYVGR